MVASNNILQAEEEFRRYHDRLRREIDKANWHFSVVKYISDISSNYLRELNQAPGFWGLTINAHMLATLMHLNNLFGKNKKDKTGKKEEKHLQMDSFLYFVGQNLNIFSKQAFEARLRKENRYDDRTQEFNSAITAEKVEQDRQKLANLPISGLKAWRERILSHLDRESVKENIDIAKQYPVKTRHIVEIIETLDNMLNEYCLAFNFSTHSKDLTIEDGIKYTLEAVKFKLEKSKKV